MTKKWAIWLVIVITLAIAGAQILLKQGAELLPKTFSPILFFAGMLTTVPFMLGALLYAGSAVLLMIALRHGEVTVLAPVLATNYLWVTLISYFILQETVSVLTWVGVLMIVTGIMLTVKGGEKDDAVYREHNASTVQQPSRAEVQHVD